MNPPALHLVLGCLFAAIDILFCVLVGAAAGLLARRGGACDANALLHAGAAFAGAFTLSLAVAAFLYSVLGGR